jgi:hypothetical protein
MLNARGNKGGFWPNLLLDTYQDFLSFGSVYALHTNLGRSKISSRGGSHAAGPRAWEPALLRNSDLLNLRR